MLRRTVNMTEVAKVKLISSDNLEFIIERKAALGSGTIKNMLSSPGNFIESIQNEIKFPDIRGEILEKICKYLEYKGKSCNHLTKSRKLKQHWRYPLVPYRA